LCASLVARYSGTPGPYPALEPTFAAFRRVKTAKKRRLRADLAHSTGLRGKYTGLPGKPYRPRPTGYRASGEIYRASGEEVSSPQHCRARSAKPLLTVSLSERLGTRQSHPLTSSSGCPGLNFAALPLGHGHYLVRAGEIKSPLGTYMLHFSSRSATKVPSRHDYPTLQVQGVTKRSLVLGLPGLGGSEAPELRVSPLPGIPRTQRRASGEITGLGGKRCRARREDIPGLGGNLTGLRGKFVVHISCKMGLFWKAAPPTV
jgi:hypothetical protein